MPAPMEPRRQTVATHGLAVNGYASTPYDTAVAPSDFFYGATGSINLERSQQPLLHLLESDQRWNRRLHLGEKVHS